MWDIIIEATGWLLELLLWMIWYDRKSDERRSCFWFIVWLIVLCLLVSVIVWWVFW